MKKLFLLLLIPFLSCKENTPNYNTKLTGTIENAKDSSVIYLTDFYFKDVGGYVDSSHVINNKFEFKFDLNEPRNFLLSGSKSFKHFVISAGDTELLIENYDSIQNLKITNGSSETKEAEEYFQIHGYENNMDYLKENPASFISLNMLWEDRFVISKTELEDYYNILSDKWKYITHAKDIEHALAVNYTPEIGVKFLDFELKDANDKVVSLSDFKDKFLLIEFTATWCGPCIAQIPFQKSAYAKFNDKDFEILHIYIEDKETMVKNIKKHQTPWKSVYAPKKFRSNIAMNNRVYYLPNMFLLDKNHKIIGTTLNPVLMMDGLEKVLHETIK